MVVWRSRVISSAPGNARPLPRSHLGILYPRRPVQQRTILTLVRHGETSANLSEVWHGSTDAPLNDRGREQALRVARFLQGRQGGYDTHSDQGRGAAGERQYDLFREVGDAIELFYRDMESIGIADDVCIVVWSEFSRRIKQNQNGTDHGTQGPMFVIGDTVNGGIYGNHPNIDPLALDGNGNTVYSQAGGDAFRSTDFRDVYGTILKHWLNMAEATILSDVLPPDAGPAASYWTTPNFDLGLLP